MPYFSGFYGKSGKIKIKIEKNVKKLLTDAGIDARISLASAVRTQRTQSTTYGEISKGSYRGGLENRLSARARGFESHSLRLPSHLKSFEKST